MATPEGRTAYLGTFKIRAEGYVVPPLDMLIAARASLSETAYDELMLLTGGSAPSPEQLCAAVEHEREILAALDAAPENFR